MGGTVRCRCGRGARAACAVACAALLALWLARVWGGEGGGRARAELASRRAFPRLAPAELAHRLADFSTLPHALSAEPGSWRVEEERGNLSTWRYRVAWTCGARCSGEAAVAAQAHGASGAPSHALARRHRVALNLRTCTEAALLPWSTACDEIEITAEVESDGAEGAVLREKAQARCGSGAGAARDALCAMELRDHRARHHAALGLADHYCNRALE